MESAKSKLFLVLALVVSLMDFISLSAQTTSLWTFDEQQGVYPSSVLTDISDNDYPLVIGPVTKIQNL